MARTVGVKQYNYRRNTSFSVKFLFFTSFFVTGFCDVIFASDCQLVNSDNEGKEILDRLSPLKGKIVEATEYDYKKNPISTFSIGICTAANKTRPQDGVVQKYTDASKGVMSVGRFDNSSVSVGINFIHLSYHGGDNCMEVCNETHKMSEIIFICNPDEEYLGPVQVLEKYNKSHPHCFYIFEMGTKYACTGKNGLSGGSIFCILFFTSITIYLLLGFLYQRLVVGAKGLEQIPHFTFWRDFGNLQADGCDFFCRCGSRQEAQSYRGIDERSPREDERDDQLLNM